MSLLKLEGLSRSFGGVKAVNGVSFEVQPGQLYGVIGPNGAGKTTLFNLITGLTPPDGGSVVLAGVETTRSRMKSSRAIIAGTRPWARWPRRS